MLKFKKIYLALTAFLTCAILSVSALAVPETAAEADFGEFSVEPLTEPAAEENPVWDEWEAPSSFTHEDIGEPVDSVNDSADSLGSEPANVADAAYTEEIISPPYDPSSGDTLPDTDEPREMFADYEKGLGEIDNISDYWEANGFPEYISFVCDQGVVSYDVATQTETVYHLWEIGIADISEEKKDEVRSLISSEQHLVFTECVYNLDARREIKEKIEKNYTLARAELSKYGEEIEVFLDGYSEDEWDKVEAEILAMFGEERGIISVLKTLPTGIPETAPEIGVPEDGVIPEIGALGTSAAVTAAETAIASNEDPANPDYYDIGGNAANNDDVPSFTKADSTDNGAGKVNNPEISAAISEVGEVAALITAEGQKDKADSLWIWICAAAATLAVIVTAFVLGKRHSFKSAGLADGGEISIGGKAVKGEIIKAVKENEIVPDDRVFEEIMEKVRDRK